MRLTDRSDSTASRITLAADRAFRNRNDGDVTTGSNLSGINVGLDGRDSI